MNSEKVKTKVPTINWMRVHIHLAYHGFFSSIDLNYSFHNTLNIHCIQKSIRNIPEFVTCMFQIWYKVTRDILNGQELLLGPRTPLPLQDVFTGAGKLYLSSSISRFITSTRYTVIQFNIIFSNILETYIWNR